MGSDADPTLVRIATQIRTGGGNSGQGLPYMHLFIDRADPGYSSSAILGASRLKTQTPRAQIAT